MTCVCGELKIGSELTGAKNWDPECEQHGLVSEWWNSDAVRAKREIDSDRLSRLQELARARKLHPATPLPEWYLEEQRRAREVCEWS